MGNVLDKFSNIYLVVLIVGFLFIGTVPKVVGLTEGSISIPYRIAVLGGSILLILSVLLSNKLHKVVFQKHAPFLIFWFFYTLRLCYDLYYSQIALATDTHVSEYTQFAFGVVLVPSVCVMMITQAYDINYNWVLKWIYRVLFFTLCLAIYSRGSTGASGRDAGDISVGILWFGQYGATLCLLSLFNVAKKRNNIKTTLFYTAGFLVGFVSIFISASKSPLLALTLVSLLFIVLWYGSAKSAFILATFGSLFYIFFTDIVSFFNDIFKSNFLERILYSIEQGGDKTREKYIITAWNEFVENPFLGNAILIQEHSISGNYPHNLIVEAFMATGFVGGIIFLAWIFRCIKRVYFVVKIRSEVAWIGLLFTQYLIFAMFSGNIFSSNLFWIFTVLVIGVVYKRKNYYNR